MNARILQVGVMKHFVAIMVALFFAASALEAAEVFTTTGSAGERVYTDKPVSGAQKLQLEVGHARQDEAKAEPQPAFEDLSPCEQARFILKEYQNASSLAERTADGGTRVLSAEEARAKIEQARADEQRICEESDDE